jgi:hypothetical protein
MAWSSDATSKPPRTNRVGAASAWPAARIRRRASAFKGLGAKICNFRGDAYTSDAVMLRRWANLSAIPPAYHMLGIHASGAMPFRARIQLFQAFPAPFPAVLRGPPEARGKGTPALPAATTRHRSSGQEESAGGVRKCDGAQHSVRSFREIQEYHSSHLLYTVCSSQIACPRFKQTRGSFLADTLSHLSDRGYAADQHRRALDLGHDAARLHGPRLCGYRPARASRATLVA